ncbi:hypothetical protein DFQ04_2637 [Algoriphagus boseongensis]|uniref:Uncharacterized protein n=1 Tax=Algoriphagus boseongensis TaxID=1442587 RepID=A0A4R6T5F1_9BACT|nr:hypothetical protein [Algoriphagus boseongensis]TDQ16519.1 hypothetical protein DFQ04_2637 [Algoriphagus boseongensis]
MNLKPFRLLFWIVAVFSIQSGFAQEEKRERLFDSEEPLAMKMSFSIKDLKANTNDSVFMTQEIEVMGVGGDWETLPFEMRTRGNFRLDRCFYPPMRIRMSKDDAKGTLFQGNRKLKLVLPCAKTKGSDSYVGKEFIAYKMYDEVSEYTFQTRLVKVTFVNTDDKKAEPTELLGFLIEDDEDAAERFEGEVMDGKKIAPQIMADTATVIHDFFQMMIGNTDWSGLYQHNQKVMKLDAQTVVPFAYDFDMTGLVNPPYAQVNSNISITKVTERLYRGFCRDQSVFDYARGIFLEKESDIMGVIDTYSAYYTEADAKAMRSFVSEFFTILKSDKMYQDKIVQSCRKPDGTYGF